MQRTVAQSSGWNGKNRTLWTSHPPYLPQRGRERSWAVGPGAGSLPGCLQHRDLSASEMCWLLYLPFSYLFGTWLAALQSKRDSLGKKDYCLGPQCLPLTCLGALGRATYLSLSCILGGRQGFRGRNGEKGILSSPRAAELSPRQACL